MTRGSVTTSRYNIGPCECPGTPHASTLSPAYTTAPDETGEMMASAGEMVPGDWAEFKDRLTFGDKRRIAAAAWQSDGLIQTVAILQSVQAWSLTDERGEVLPINISTIDELSPEQGDLILKISDRPVFKRDSLPNSTSGSSVHGPAPTSTQNSSPTSTPTSS